MSLSAFPSSYLKLLGMTVHMRMNEDESVVIDSAFLNSLMACMNFLQCF